MNDDPFFPLGSQAFVSELKTARLRLEPVTADVAAELNAGIAASITELSPWLPWAKECPRIADTTDFCVRSAEQISARTDLPLIMRLAASDELLGSVGLHRIEWSVPAFEVGYWCVTSHTGNGYITEAVRELARYVFDELGAVRLALHADPRNRASCAVAERLGFHLDGVLRNDCRDNSDQPASTAIYSLTSLDEMARKD